MNIIITGASQGIGYSTAQSLAKLGNHTIIGIARNKNKLLQLKNEISSINSNAKFIPMVFDLKELNQKPQELLNLIVSYVDRVDILINNAGLLYAKPYSELSTQEIFEMISINYFAPAILIKSLIPIFSSRCHVVNISSMGGFQGSVKFPGLAIYASSKAALASLTENLAEEYKDKGFSFNCLALGATDTEMLRTAFPGYNAPISADEMGAFVAEFSINGHKYFNGKILPVSTSTP
jgi:short-subunit dehydrogenase